MKFSKIVHVEEKLDPTCTNEYRNTINTYVLLTAVNKKNPVMKYFKFATRAGIHHFSNFKDIKFLDIKQEYSYFITPIYSVVCKYMGQRWKYDRATRTSGQVTALIQRKLYDIDNLVEITEDEANELLLSALL